MMNLTSVALLSLAPTATLVTQGAAQILEAGRDFTMQFSGASEVDKPAKPDSRSAFQKAFEGLLEPLREYLNKQGYSSYEFDLVSDGGDELTIDADPHLAQTVNDWIDAQPEWKAKWQQQASEKIATNANDPNTGRTYPWQSLEEPSRLSSSATLRYRAVRD